MMGIIKQSLLITAAIPFIIVVGCVVYGMFLFLLFGLPYIIIEGNYFYAVPYAVILFTVVFALVAYATYIEPTLNQE